MGFAYFTAVKLVGYSIAGAYLRRQLQTGRAHPVVFGLVRTLVGIAVGVSTSLIFVAFAGERSLLFYVLLAPIRFLEWYLVLLLFFGRPQGTAVVSVDSTLRFNLEAAVRQERFPALAAQGILWSYLLDLPAVLAVFVVPGGAWIC